MKVFLIGFMGSGKTTLGALLAGELGYDFVDLDNVIADKADMPISDVFATRGEGEFRKIESTCLEQVAGGAGDLVVATGGGVPIRPDNRALMHAAGLIVWLEAPWRVISQRLGPAEVSSRPLLRDLTAARDLFAERQPAYRESADLIIDGSDANVRRTLQRLLQSLAEAPCDT